MIVAIIALIFSVGLAVKTVLYRSPEIPEREKMHEQPLSGDASTERQVQRVASNFKCACGGCGELRLVECDCDMPRGAMEMKAFIREKLRDGFTTDQVIKWVEMEYGNRVAG
jgi:cytochrome c-type biogenesis protein CcmH/NrfF